MFWQFLALLGFWIPVKKALPDRAYFDWVIVSAVDSYGFRPLPKIAEYASHSKEWHYNFDRETDYVRSLKVTHWHRLPRNKWK